MAHPYIPPLVSSLYILIEKQNFVSRSFCVFVLRTIASSKLAMESIRLVLSGQNMGNVTNRFEHVRLLTDIHQKIYRHPEIKCVCPGFINFTFVGVVYFCK